MDTALFQWINGWPHPEWAEWSVRFIERSFSESIRYGLVSVVFVLGLLLRKNRWWQAALCLLFAMSFALWTTLLLKPVVHRPRPKAVLQNVHTTVTTGANQSFPAGIAVRYAAIAAFMIFLSKKGRVFWALLIFVTGLSRIYGGAHWPSDILGAWVISFFYAWMAHKAYNYLKDKFKGGKIY